ncbi:G-alpha-domain-containing protein [Cristinia sonorae]|uniref:G-alpha-domain-containing protein n=1 Tax=Cristinia sonorae TaxID=1940300 RepID=A0A8K0UDV6_9AGAR|nr:G-alpha-domain-containing protein [Cristinia sonorae]
MSGSLDSPDPLAILIAPPPNESPASRAERLQAEAEARRVSEQIDEEIRRERMDQRKWEKEKRTVKVLLLGQSESGKSTTIKNFQMAYAPNSFAQELSSWRSVIYLNLARSILTILDHLSKEASRLNPDASSSSSLEVPLSQSSLVAMASSSSAEDDADLKFTPVTSPQGSASELGMSVEDSPGTPSSPSSPPFPPELAERAARSRGASTSTDSPSDKFIFTSVHAALLARLYPPLRKVQETLEGTLGAPEPSPNSPYGSAAQSSAENYQSPHEPNWRPNARRPKEFAITTRTGWRAALMKVRERISTSSASSLHSTSSKKAGKRRRRDMDVDEARDVLCELSTDMQALWEDKHVRTLLRIKKVRLEERSGFFLDDISRIATLRYEPTSDDVVRARLRTMGVQEYSFISEKVDKENIASGLLGYNSKKVAAGETIKRNGPLGIEPGREWIIYDVGGARSNRQAWLPYFTNLNAIIFLAPISCFDERLAEDPRVNRLEDSLILWKTIVSSDVLRGVQLILFLNKCDLLQKKIHRGVRVADYVSSYGDRPNDAKSVAKYLRQQFKDISMRHSPQQRQFFSFFTSVTDTKATAITVAAVREGIQRTNLRKVELI